MRNYLLAALATTALAIGVFDAPAAAQASTWTAKWSHVGAQLADVQAYGKSVFADGTLLTAPITCEQVVGATTPTVDCQTTFPALSQAAHVFKVRTVFNGVERELSTTVDPTKGPTSATSIRLTIVTVTP